MVTASGLAICFSCGRDITPKDDQFTTGPGLGRFGETYHRSCFYEGVGPLEYSFGKGTLQPTVSRHGDADHSMFLCFFGRPEYDSRKPILTKSYVEQTRHIVIGLNEGTMTEDEARRELDAIYW